MSKETPVSTTKPESTRSSDRATTTGVVPNVVHLALDVADRGQTSALALLSDGRAELVQLVNGGIELAEKATASFFRLLKKATAHLDQATAETLVTVERIANGAVKGARETTRAATDLASTAAGALASN